MKAAFQSVTLIGKDTYEFSYLPEKPIDYTAGQFVEITLPHPDPDNRGTRRWFTLVSAPEEPLLKIATKKPANLSSFKQALFAMKPGKSLELSQAMGDFVLPRQRSIPILFIAAGIGITPVRSIITSLSLADEQRIVGLLYISRETTPPYSQELFSYCSDIQFVQPNESISTCAAYVANSAATQPNLHVYISGPEQFVEIMQAELQTIISPNRLVTDFFHGYN